jgi:hypothetical protein
MKRYFLFDLMVVSIRVRPLTPPIKLRIPRNAGQAWPIENPATRGRIRLWLAPEMGCFKPYKLKVSEVI